MLNLSRYTLTSQAHIKLLATKVRQKGYQAWIPERVTQENHQDFIIAMWRNLTAKERLTPETFKERVLVAAHAHIAWKLYEETAGSANSATREIHPIITNAGLEWTSDSKKKRMCKWYHAYLHDIGLAGLEGYLSSQIFTMEKEIRPLVTFLKQVAHGKDPDYEELEAEETGESDSAEEHD